MPLTQEELDQLTPEFLNKNEIPEFLKPAVEKGFILRTPGMEEQFKTNYKTSIAAEIGRDNFTSVDAAVKEVAGIEKKSGEKATDYLKRAFTEATTELGELRTAKANGTLTALEKERLATLTEALKTKDTDIATLKEQHQKELLSFQVSAEVGNAFNAIKGRLKKDLLGAEDITAARIAKFNADYKPEQVKEGDKISIIFRDTKGEVVNNPTTYKPATAAELMEGIFEPYIEKKVEQGGGGSGRSNANGGGGNNEPKTKDTYAPSADIKTKVQLSDDLKRSGILAGTADFTELLNKFGKDLPTR